MRALLFLFLALSVVAVRERKLYDTLGVEPDADDRTIKRAYKKQALKWHPDRNLDNKKRAEEKFREVAAAYEVLSDEEKRQVYDQYGEAGLKQQQGGGPGGPGGPGGFGGDPFEMFSQFFGGGMGGGGMGGQRVHFQFGSGGMPGGGFAGGGMGGSPFGGHHQQQRAQQQQPQGDLYEDDPHVESLDASSFPEPTTDWVWLVEFYAPWCGHCQALSPKWKRAAASLKGVVRLGAVNCDEHKALCQQHGVKGYPTIKALVPGSAPGKAGIWVEYNGERGAAALARWATSLIPARVAQLRTKADLEGLLAQCGGTSKGGKRDKADTASWALCVVLVSDKGEVPALWKALSRAFMGRVAFGFARQGAAGEVLQALGDKVGGSGSAVVALCNGDLEDVEHYEGALKSDPLQRYVRRHTSGKQCMSRMRLDAGSDLRRLSIAQLKAVIAARGVDCTGCLEKGDYVRALRAALEQPTDSSQDQHQQKEEL